MTGGEHPARPSLPRLVVDPGVYVSAAISGTGAPAQLLETAVEGRAVLLVSPLLLAELREVLARRKFRRWLPEEDATAFVDAVVLIAARVDDPPEETRGRVCRDPDDDYLVALAESAEATLLVSGDRDLLAVRRPGLDVRSPRDAVAAITHQRTLGSALMTAGGESAWAAAEAAGNGDVLQTSVTFLAVLDEPTAPDLLPHIVTPESLYRWQADLEEVRRAISGRGMATGVDYPQEGVAYVKLPPDPGETVRATGEVVVEKAAILTLQRRPELPDALGLGGWRVHSVGDYVRPEDLPTPAP